MENILRIVIGGEYAQLDAQKDCYMLGVRNSRGEYFIIKTANDLETMTEIAKQLKKEINNIAFELEYGSTLKDIKEVSKGDNNDTL